MSYIYINPNPSNKSVGDCVVRAISIIEQKSWEDIFVDLALYGFMEHDMPSSNAVWGKYLIDKGYKKYIIPDACPDCYTVRMFTEDFPNLVGILATGSHVVAVDRGNYYDAWDSGCEVPIYYWKKEIL